MYSIRSIRRGRTPARRRSELGPYPASSTTSQVKRLQARAANTTYALDWPALLNLIVRKDWSVMRRVKSIQAGEMPSRLFHATQLFLAEDGATLVASAQKKETSGMLVWMVDYTPARYFDEKTRSASKRQFVMVANDITFQSGSFAVPEDVVFTAACELARAERLPFVYISANSGARLGLSTDVKKRFLVAFTPNNEIDYLYLKEADLKELESQKIQMDTTLVTVGDEKRYVLNGIVGGPSEYLGVENLSGSGLVAGQMSKNYSTIPTISVVSGRSVGIGAYLNRLGRRVIQTNDAPLILTGASALNRLLGKDVYSDNSQLGGRQIMVPNGVTHWSTKNDYGSARTLLRWLDYVPPVVHPLRCSPRVLTSTVEDPVDRDVTFTPEPNTPYDPRFLVTGVMERTGLFDRGSWTESLDGWAKTVVSGRASLGGIPCGVILVETRLTKKFNPADPADPTSASSFTTQAGQVWFPDSARKTADSLDDFHHERLPCFIFANWRGFSGGMRDMYDEVLKFGASIVDNLRVYTAPVFIYIPPFGELRGGAWVVVDPVINHNNVVEMYCDPSSRGGILEPSGVAEIKFRDNDVRELIRRCRPDLTTMEPKKARQEEGDLLPRFRDVAVKFADLHDTHVRMKAVGVVRDVIPWKNSRRIFYDKLTRKLAELDLANTILEAGDAASLAEAVTKVQQRYAAECPAGPAWGTADAEHLKWLEAAKKSKAFAAGSHAKKESKAPAAGGVDEIRQLLKTMKAKGGNLRDCFAELFVDEDLTEAATSALPTIHSLAASTKPGPEAVKEKHSKK
ncbi:acetyl-CoA carboxylase [Strigomonas culicis]|uniref:Acetyl-CoA carboxylase n=1 Tax=Strigomonas culicis TaxID=28005 RepID=S9V6A5_9TRYP|nr:acetyl-CoA carboxylase [Strigomonas culicis]|eukprot:EPY36584.1 acetyl-CoA carboxylase [Strigomonas culicis]